MQALLFLSFFALSFASWVAIPDTDMAYLVDTINHYRDGFQWVDGAIDTVEMLEDTDEDIEGTCLALTEYTSFSADYWDDVDAPYDNFQEFVDYYLNPALLTCTADGETFDLDCDGGLCEDSDVLFGLIFNPDFAGVSCFESGSDDGTDACDDASIACVFFEADGDNVVTEGVVTSDYSTTECPECGDDLRFLAVDDDDEFYWEGCDAAADVEGCDMDTCLEEEGYKCTDETDSWVTDDCMPVCGDGIIIDDDTEDPEECDSGATAITGCTSSCVVRLGYECSENAAGTTTSCTVLGGWDCPTDVNANCATVCGDSYTVEGVEECDDGNTVATDGCTNACDVVSGWECKVWYDDDDQDSECSPVMGDGAIVGTEECDDGNNNDDDGCADGSVTEDDECTGQPSLCAPDGWAENDDPFADVNIDAWIDSASLTALAVWAESAAGPDAIVDATFTNPTTSTAVIVASFDLVAPTGSSGIDYSDIRAAIEAVRSEIGTTYSDMCREAVVAGDLEDISEDDCDFIDALSQSVWAEIYPQNTGADEISFDDLSDLTASFRVVSRYYSGANVLVCGFAFLVAALYAAFN